MADALTPLVEQVRNAVAEVRLLRLRGGGTKDFYGGALRGDILDTRGHSGILSHEPTELVVTVRGGTLLEELEAALAAKGQMLPFEPPHFGAGATIGGCVAAGLAGPRRAAAGGVRDFVLGARLLDGQARVLGFGGQVMKNVAGYDVSRLLAGSLGILGVILEVSLKVLPRPAIERTLQFEMSEPQALDALSRWGGEPLPLSASVWQDGRLALRLSGSEAGVRAACAKLGGEVADAPEIWQGVREQTDGFFTGDAPLWRLSLPSAAPVIALPGRQLIEWGGALRWWKTDAPAAEVRVAAERTGGHATLFRARDKSAGVFAPLSSVQMRLHRGLKAAFDPKGIFNPGRLVAEL